MGTTLPSAPTELSQYPKLCELRRKFPVLYRVEFQVRSFILQNYMTLKGSGPFTGRINDSEESQGIIQDRQESLHAQA